MGQNHPQVPLHTVSQEDINKSISILFDNQQQQFQAGNISIQMQNILHSLCNQIPLQMTQSGIKLNPYMLKILFHQKFQVTLSKLISLLIEKLEQLGKRNVLLVKREEWMSLLHLVCFIVVFTNQKIIKTVERFTLKESELCEETKRIIEDFQNKQKKFNSTDIIDKLASTQAQLLSSSLHTTLLNLINLHIQPITRSSATLQVIQYVELASFMLFTRIFFTPHHHKALLEKARKSITLKDLMIIGEYFMASGSDLCLTSVYESAVLLLICLIEGNGRNLKSIVSDAKGLPSHLFKHLPIVKQKTLDDFIAVTGLFSLCYVKEGTNLYQRFAFNRLLSLRLIDSLVKEIKVSSGQITEMLEELTLQTKIGAVQRAFVTEIVRCYTKLVHEKISQDKRLIALRQGRSNFSETISKFSSKIISKITRTPLPISQQQQTSIPSHCRQSYHSGILKKYLQSGTQPFNVKYQCKKYTIPYIAVIDQMQKDDLIIKQQISQLSQKFVYEFVLRKKVVYQHNDRFVWNDILPAIIEGHELKGEEIRESEMSLRQSKNESRVGVMGYVPVISQKPLASSKRKIEEGVSSESRTSNAAKTKFQRNDTEGQCIYNLTTEALKTEQRTAQNKISEFIANDSSIQDSMKKQKFQSIDVQGQKDHENKYYVQNSESEIFHPEAVKKNNIHEKEDIEEEKYQIEDN